MKIKRKSLARSVEGAAAIEFALMLPLLLLVFYGMLVFSNYVLITRRMDSAVNDVAFLISREGQIAFNTDSQNRFTGGSRYLDGLAQTAIPIIMHPFIANDYSYNIKMVGTPFYSSVPVNACDENDKVMKVMWSHSGAGEGGNEAFFPPQYNVACEDRSFETGSGPKPYAFSTFMAAADINNAEAGVTSYLPSQAYIVLGLAYTYDQNNDNGPSYIGNVVLQGLQFLAFAIPGMPPQMVKVAAYPVRFVVRRDVDGNGVISSNEYFTQLQTCTDCSDLNSVLTNEGGSERRACNAASVAGANYGGCNFSFF